MRTVLALILEWLMPARGTRRRPAEGAVRNTTPAGSPMRRLIITHGAARVGHPGHPTTFIEADGLPLVRPMSSPTRGSRYDDASGTGDGRPCRRHSDRTARQGWPHDPARPCEQASPSPPVGR